MTSGIRLAGRTDCVQPSATLAITARAAELKSSGVDVVSFGAGEPDFDTPEHIKEAARAAMAAGFTKYTAVEGTIELRQAICETLGRDRRLEYAPSQILVTAGAKHALFNLALALFEPGDEVIIPKPYWVTYPEQVRLVGAMPVLVDTDEANGFRLTAAELDRAITKKTRALLLCTPSNPTGAAYTAGELAALGEVLRPTSALVVSDEIYASLVYDGFVHRSIAEVVPELAERTIIVDGASKTYAMTGWRIGWMAGPKEIVAACAVMQSQSTSNATSIAQKAAVAALRGPQDCVETMRRAFAERRRRILDLLRAIPGVACREPEGAFYAFADFRRVCERRFHGQPIGDSTALGRYLLEEARVAVVPGAAFGAEGYLRLSYATSMDRIEEGLRRIATAVAALS